MRCHICNAALSAGEIQRNHDHKDWDPCNRCLEAIDDVFNDRTEEEIDEELSLLLYEDEPTAEELLENSNLEE